MIFLIFVMVRAGGLDDASCSVVTPRLGLGVHEFLDRKRWIGRRKLVDAKAKPWDDVIGGRPQRGPKEDTRVILPENRRCACRRGNPRDRLFRNRARGWPSL